jgi:hypothetical protein
MLPADSSDQRTAVVSLRGPALGRGARVSINAPLAVAVQYVQIEFAAITAPIVHPHGEPDRPRTSYRLATAAEGGVSQDNVLEGRIICLKG